MVGSIARILKNRAANAGYFLKTNALTMPFRRRKYLAEEKGFRPRAYSDPVFSSVESELRRDGVTCLRGRYSDFSKALEIKYIASFLEGKKPDHASDLLNLQFPASFGRVFEAATSFQEPAVQKIVFDSDLVALMYNYLRRTPYYRNNPSLVTVRASATDKQPAGEFHTDGGLRQLSYMLLLNEVTEDTTHMEYLTGSHNVRFAMKMYRENLTDKKIIDSFPLYRLTGSAGDLFVFDAGNGFHRANVIPGTIRSILHFNINTGYELQEAKFDSRSQWKALATASADVGRMLDKVTSP